MSMNLHLSASFDTIAPQGHDFEVRESFNLDQTPTDVTLEALNSGDPHKFYINWIEERFGKNDESSCHLEELEKWLKDHEGWEIEWFML